MNSVTERGLEVPRESEQNDWRLGAADRRSGFGGEFGYEEEEWRLGFFNADWVEH